MAALGAWIDHALDITEADLQALLTKKESAVDEVLVNEDPLLAAFCQEETAGSVEALPASVTAAWRQVPAGGLGSSTPLAQWANVAAVGGDALSPSASLQSTTWQHYYDSAVSSCMASYGSPPPPAASMCSPYGAALSARAQSLSGASGSGSFSSMLTDVGGGAAGLHHEAHMREPAALVMLPWQAAAELIVGAPAGAASRRARAPPGRSASGLLAATERPAQQLMMGQPDVTVRPMKRSASEPAGLEAYASRKAPRLVAVAHAAAGSSELQRTAVNHREMQHAATRKEQQRRAVHARLALLRLHQKQAEQGL